MLNELKQYGWKTVAGFFSFIVIWNSFYIVGGTEYAVERTPSGEITIDVGTGY